MGNAKQRKAASVRWWNPLLDIASLVDDDVGRAQNLIALALAQMDKDGLTVSAPQSIVEVAKSVHGRMGRGNPGGSNGDGVEIHEGKRVIRLGQ